MVLVPLYSIYCYLLCSDKTSIQLSSCKFDFQNYSSTTTAFLYILKAREHHDRKLAIKVGDNKMLRILGHRK